MSLSIRLTLLLSLVVTVTLFIVWAGTRRVVLHPFAEAVLTTHLDQISFLADAIEDGEDGRALAEEMNLKARLSPRRPKVLRRRHGRRPLPKGVAPASANVRVPRAHWSRRRRNERGLADRSPRDRRRVSGTAIRLVAGARRTGDLRSQCHGRDLDAAASSGLGPGHGANGRRRPVIPTSGERPSGRRDHGSGVQCAGRPRRDPAAGGARAHGRDQPRAPHAAHPAAARDRAAEGFRSPPAAPRRDGVRPSRRRQSDRRAARSLPLVDRGAPALRGGGFPRCGRRGSGRSNPAARPHGHGRGHRGTLSRRPDSNGAGGSQSTQ